MTERRIARVLVRRILLAYLTAAALVTMALMAEDIVDVKAGMTREAALHAASVEEALAHALWSMDHAAAAAVVNGMVSAPLIGWVEVIDAVTNRVVAEGGDPSRAAGEGVRFPLVHQHAAGADNVGALVIHADPSQMWARLWPRLASVLAGAAVKTVILWWILSRVVTRIVHHPLKRLTAVVRDFTPGAGPSSGTAAAAVTGVPGTELALLAETFDRMAERVAENVQLRERACVLEQTEVLARQLTQSNSELEKFAYVVSHDLRQPLRMVNSFSQLLRRKLGDELDDETREYLDFIHDGVSRMDQMMQSLLEYSRVGRSGEPMEETDCGPLVAEALGFLRPNIEESAAVLEMPASWPTVVVSRNEIVRLFQNLVGNALKYRAAGRPPHIALAVERRDEYWEFSVADNGIGIPPGQAERLFNVFQRLHARDAYEGTGIGLAVCRRIVERHGGRIWVESDGDDQGAIFRFTLPVLTPATA